MRLTVHSNRIQMESQLDTVMERQKVNEIQPVHTAMESETCLVVPHDDLVRYRIQNLTQFQT